MFKSIFNKKGKDDSGEDFYPALLNLIREIGEVEDINKDTLFTSIGFDSVKYINLLLQLEDVVGIELEELVEKMDLTQINTIEDLHTFLKNIKSR